MNDATRERLLQVVIAEWTIAAVLTLAALICFACNRRASFLFLPWLGIASIAALHGTLFYNDGSGDRVGLAVFGAVVGLFLGAPAGTVLMLVLRRRTTS